MPKTPSEELRLPAVFGRYVLLHRLSRGGMGEIFLARVGEIQGFEKPIVIKKILPHLSRDAEFLERFVAEAKIAIQLTHGNIVPVYEVGMVDGEYFLALQHIEGRDLRALTGRLRERGQHLSAELALYVVRELANGLAYAHRRTDETGRSLELVHCDVSPPNILLSNEGEVKIIDFGIAKSAMLRAQENDEVGFGKFGYMAPEQLVRGGVVDRRTDLYSTGVILYELLTGQRLFNFPPGTDYKQIAREVTAGRFTAPSQREPSLDSRLDGLVLRALRTAPDERYQSAEELRDAVQQHLYAMHPTISADDLATFIHELFASEFEADRQMLRMVSKADVGSFKSAIDDATTHTVSYALADRWSASGSGRPALVISRVDLPGSQRPPDIRRFAPKARATPPPIPIVSSAPPTSRGAASPPTTGPSRPQAAVPSGAPPLPAPSLAPAAPPGTGPSRALPRAEVSRPIRIASEEERSGRKRQATRKMSDPERLVAVKEASTSSIFRTTGRSRLAGLVAGATILVVGGGAVATFLLSSSKSRSRGLDAGAGGVPSRGPGSGSGSTAGGRWRADSGASHLSFAPDEVERTRPDAASTGAPRSAGGSTVTRLKKGRTAKGRLEPRFPAPAAAVVVQEKFREVRKEYQEFTRSYGRRLDREWQRILFAHTYGNKDDTSYRLLNEMLDDLKRKMRQQH
jgi:serine/threonine protein kinase